VDARVGELVEGEVEQLDGTFGVVQRFDQRLRGQGEGILYTYMYRYIDIDG